MNPNKRSPWKMALLQWIMIVVVVSLVTYSIMSMINQIRLQTYIESSWSDEPDMVTTDPVAENEMTRSSSRPKFHIAVTASDRVYNKWQCRIMYYYYNKFKDAPGSDMGGFTRILHTGYPDNLVHEIPTFVADRLPFHLDMGYVVLNRPWVFVQWLAKANIEEEYILMAEPDHIFVKPLPNLAHGSNPAAYPFFYIKPAKHEHLLRKFYPEKMGPITNVDPIGNSPVIIKKSLMEEIAPTWVNISLQINNDPEAVKAFGWVREMYGYAVASALHGVKHTLINNFMTQPPYELEGGEYYIIHYTYSCDFDKEGVLLKYGDRGDWTFDKRLYLDKPMPRNLTLPPPRVPQNVVRLVKMVNEATSNIPGWDSLAPEAPWI